MCFFSSGSNVSSSTKKADEEVKAVSKSRLLETEGENKGSVLNAGQGRSVRKIFGN